jgi:hypothetical protein
MLNKITASRVWPQATKNPSFPFAPGVSEHRSRRISSKKWSELIKKVWEAQPGSIA